MWPITSITGNFFVVTKDELNSYIGCNSGIVILNDRYKEQSVCFVDNITNLYTSDQAPFVYISTSGNGVKLFSKDYKEYPPDTTDYIGTFKRIEELSGDVVNHVHALDFNTVSISTNSGISVSINNIVYNKDLSEPVFKSLLTENYIYYNTNNAFYRKNFPITQNDWIEDYKLDFTSNPSISGDILDIDVKGDIITILTTSTGILIIEDKQNINNSLVFDFTQHISGFNIVKAEYTYLDGLSVGGSIILAGVSGLKVIELDTLTEIEFISSPKLSSSNILDLVKV